MGTSSAMSAWCVASNAMHTSSSAAFESSGSFRNKLTSPTIAAWQVYRVVAFALVDYDFRQDPGTNIKAAALLTASTGCIAGQHAIAVPKDGF